MTVKRSTDNIVMKLLQSIYRVLSMFRKQDRDGHSSS